MPTNDQFKYLRVYPTGALFETVTGYFSFIYGSDGAERYYDKVLTGKSSPFRLPTSLSGLQAVPHQHRPEPVDHPHGAQPSPEGRGRASSPAGTGRSWPSTRAPGSILAMYSNPSFDPNLLSSHDLAKVQASYKALTAVPGALDPAAYRQRWFPGSSFKVVTSVGGLRPPTRRSPPSRSPTSPPCPSPRRPTSCTTSAARCAAGSCLQLFTVSCDTGFGQIGLDLGGQKLSGEAQSFGFNKVPPIDLPFPTSSVFPSAASFVLDQPGLAYSAIGQQNVQASPLQMALVAGAIADGGVMMTPHILDDVTNSQNQVVSTYQPSTWLHATSAGHRRPGHAADALGGQLARRHRHRGQHPGVAVAGKTGTAQTGTGQIDAWFVAFAPAANPVIAVAVLLPNQPSANEYQGGTLAAPIAKAIIEADLAPPKVDHQALLRLRPGAGRP